MQSEKLESIETPDLRNECAAPPISLEGPAATLRFDLEKHREQLLTVCHATDWRDVVETLEYSLADKEFKPEYKLSLQVIREILDELRDLCRKRGMHTELMEEDRQMGEERRSGAGR